MAPAQALLGRVGVVKSPENSQQWPSIRNRLLATGIQFCLIESQNWEKSQDLKDIKVLFLPNVEQITGLQVAALEDWMKQGGRVVVSGPTGNLAESEVKTQLRSLLGAYWGYINSSPSTLKLQETAQLSFLNPANLSATFIGGVIIPSDINAQPAAVWLTEGKPPGVVVNDNSIFLGWRWGVDGVTSAAFDTTWLKTALNRYGINANNQLVVVNSVDIPACDANATTPREPFPILPPEYIPKPETPPQTPVTPLPDSSLPSPNLRSDRTLQSSDYPVLSPPISGISSQQAQAMSQELQNLIARFESTLLTAQANSVPMVALPSEQLKNAAQPHLNASLHESQQVLNEAKQSLKAFQQLVNQQQYDQARQLWLKARRSLWDSYPAEHQFMQPEVRAMWLDRGTIVKTRSEADLAVIFDRMAEAGINTVFIETVNASYPIYPSRVAPEQNPLTKGWDPLRVAIKLAHERNIEIHAWVWLFAAANQGHNQVLGQPADYLGPVLSQNPDWGITDQDGNYFDKGPQFKKAFLDPANPKVQQYLLALVEEIATNYDVDGIQFDYIRYPFQQPQVNQTFGYSKSSRYLFKDMTGVDPIEISPGHPLWNQWTGFRIRQIDSFVSTVSRRLKEKKPDLILSASVFPIERNDRLFRLQQNWEEWMSQGWIDMIVLMTYALDTGNLEERTQAAFDDSLPKSSLIIPGLRLLKVPDPVTIDQLQLVRNMPIGGFSLFATENLTPSLQTLLSRSQPPQTPQPLPYRQPFQAAYGRYQALQKEWGFLLSQQQLMIPKANLNDWSQQERQLSQALGQLASQPSPQNLATARRILSQFQRQFPNWMNQQKRLQPYQVQVWENRLETLEKLLAYGERKVIQEGRGRISQK
ncbi:family 10 glycosylhydrolase [Crocosphaera sp. XPORK-15E]|uniref:family 10 glycosylhydrolase n=1 Tax=Crocosphaera sp. XPORK-15E TaxID=3110247 RepID=UPI002B20CCC9|nr:family 10 glycosylhydrolase [Crocosphaera sp. XPORK-15E]MEA5533975.1 family 10 glycosylhydrolase [Crocosphaera sp. XPORK-15E]